MALDWRALLRDRRAWAVAGIGGVGGLYLAARARKGGPAASQDALYDPNAPANVGMQPSVYDSSLQDIAEGFQQTALDLQTQVSGIQAQLDQRTPATPPPVTPARREIWRGAKVTRRQTLYGFAQQHGGTLQEIIAHNPWLAGKAGSYRLRPGQIIKVRPLRNAG